MKARTKTRLTIAAGTLAAVAAVSILALPALAAPKTASLRVVTSQDTSKAVPTEGAIAELRISRPEAGYMVPVLRIELYESDNFTTRLRPGRYVIAYGSRSCVGTCEHLDRPAAVCSRTVTLRAGHGVRVSARVIWPGVTGSVTCRMLLRRT